MTDKEDLISRSELKKTIINICGNCSNIIREYKDGVPDGNCAIQHIMNMIDNAPTVEPTQSGHWVEEKISAGARKVFCSECGCPPPFEYVSTGDVYSASGYGVINKTKFCPNCGADMRKGGAE